MFSLYASLLLICSQIHSLHMFPRPLYPRSWAALAGDWRRDTAAHISPAFPSASSRAASSHWFHSTERAMLRMLSSLGSQVLAIPSPCLFCPILGCGSLQFSWLPECFITPVWHFNSPHTLGKELISVSSFENRDKDNVNWGCFEDRGEKKIHTGNSLVVQWLGLRDFTVQARGAIPGRETKISQVMRGGQKGKNNNKHIKNLACCWAQNR